MSDQSITSWIRQPASIILIIAVAIMAVMLMDQRQKTDPVPKSSPVVKAPSTEPVKPATVKAPALIKKEASPPSMAGPSGGEMPKIVQRMGGSSQAPAQPGTQPGQLTAPDLGSLLGRMEKKVEAEPENINNRLLLAQTYSELDLDDKAILHARTAVKQQPDHARAKLVLGSVLSKRIAENDLNESVTLLKSLSSNPDVKQYLVDMYLGDALIRLGDHQSAVASWKKALQGMPASDNRRAGIEKRIADISAGNPGG